MVEGERILGRFTVAERLGAGGNGTVHRAWDERLHRAVAIKEVRGDAGGRVLREAHAAARLNHRGIVTIYELGTENGHAYLVTELVAGPNLREAAARGELSDREVAEIGVEVCAAVAHAHAHGVVHRDIKPDNVIVRERRAPRILDSGGRAKLGDFGIASVAESPSLTETGQVVGTLAYMAPEQAAGEPPGPPADVYSLALTLYELWAGLNPVAGKTPAATARAIGEPIAPLTQLRAELPADLCASLSACLVADPDQRPGIEELRGALLAARGALHPEREVPEPRDSAALTPLPAQIPARPFAVLLGVGVLATLGMLAGLPGLALIAAALLAPAILLLRRPSEWLLAAAAPLLGLIGLAPVFVVIAASNPRAAARPALALLGWAWAGIAGAILGVSLGVVDVAAASGWSTAGREAVDGVLAPLLSGEVVSIALIWLGAAILLGLVLDVCGPAMIAVLGLIWAAGLVAVSGVVGGAAEPSMLLAPALIAAIALLIWNRLGRPDPRPYLNPGPRRGRVPRQSARPRAGIKAHPAQLADAELRATGTAVRHVEAALHRGRSPRRAA